MLVSTFVEGESGFAVGNCKTSVSLLDDSVKVGSCLRFVSLFCDRFAQLLLYLIVFMITLYPYVFMVKYKCDNSICFMNNVRCQEVNSLCFVF